MTRKPKPPFQRAAAELIRDGTGSYRGDTIILSAKVRGRTVEVPFVVREGDFVFGPFHDAARELRLHVECLLDGEVSQP